MGAWISKELGGYIGCAILNPNFGALISFKFNLIVHTFLFREFLGHS